MSLHIQLQQNVQLITPNLYERNDLHVIKKNN